MKKALRGISAFLIICFINMIFPFPALAGEIGSAISKLTPKQKEKIKNLSPKEKSEIKALLGLKEAAPVQSASGEDTLLKKKALSDDTAISGPRELKAVGLQSVVEVTNEGFSEIEKGFLRKNAGDLEKPLKQFGYDIFSKTVGMRFALLPSIPLGPDYRINPGDKLLATIWGDVNDTIVLEVDERGAVTLPRVGVVTVAGMTIINARDLLYERLGKVFITDFNIDLTIKEIGSIKVYMLGEFKKPGAYTILANTTLYDAIFIGGGPTRNGSLRKIELVRNGVKIKTVDLYNFILTGSKKNDVLLKSGDVIRVPAIGKLVAISGNVRRPAIYELISNKTELKDFIGLAGGITPTTYLQRIQIERKKENRELTAIDINYADYLKVKHVKPVYLKNLDYISIFSIEPTVRNVVYLSGNVVRPGQYELEPGMRLMDLFIKAEGLSPGAYMERAQIFRLVPPDMHPRIIAVDLRKMKMGDPEHNPWLFEFDRVRVLAQKDIEGQPRVFVSGELNDGDGSYVLSDDMRVSDLLFQAGGVKDGAYLEKAELFRTENGQVYFYALDLNKILKEGDRNQDILLKKDDYLFVRRIPDYGINKTITLSGEVRYPGKYAIYKGERLSSVIERAGGYTENAFLEGAVFVRESMKKKQLDDIDKLKKNLSEERAWLINQIPLGLPSGEVDVRRTQIEKRYYFQFKKLEMEIPGRIIIDLRKAEGGDQNNLVLQDGDSFTIPPQVNGISVVGQVYSPGTILYEKGKPMGYYINACGGRTKFADPDKVFIRRANGKTEEKGWFTAMERGDTIVIPGKDIELTRYQKPFDWNEFWSTTARATSAFADAATALVTVYLLYRSTNN